MPMLSIERRELTPAHVLIVRARCARHELAKTMGECFGKAFPYAMRDRRAARGPSVHALPLDGPGLFTIESGCVLGLGGARLGTTSKPRRLPGGRRPSRCMAAPTTRSARPTPRWSVDGKERLKPGGRRGSRTSPTRRNIQTRQLAHRNLLAAGDR
jgi:hypothetical protein